MNDIEHKTIDTISDKYSNFTEIIYTPIGAIVPVIDKFKDLISKIQTDLKIIIEDSPFAPKLKGVEPSVNEGDIDDACDDMDGLNLENKKEFKVYRKIQGTGSTVEYYIVPKFWLADVLKDTETMTVKTDSWLIENKHEYEKMENPKFTSELRDYQIPIVDKVEAAIYSKGGGILSVPCGRGKTCMAINIAARLGLKTLVIVHRTDFILQWKADIEKFTNLKVGILQQNTIDVDGKDIVIGMLKSISMKDYHHSIFEQFGFVIVDEVHNISTRLYSKALCKVMPKYTLGLSATPYRDDGLDRVYRWFLGDILYHETNTIELPVTVEMIKYFISDNATAIDKKRFRYIYNPRTKMANTPIMISNLSKVNERNEYVNTKLMDILSNRPERKVLILGSRVQQLEELMTLFDNSKKNVPSTAHITSALYVGGMKPEKYILAKEKDVLFATFEMVGEGFNLEKLNTLIMCSPRSNSKTSNKLQQYVGRILRTQDSTVAPLVVDIHDQINVFMNQGLKRLDYYRSEGYKIDHYVLTNKKEEFVRTESSTKIQKKCKQARRNDKTESNNLSVSNMFDSDDE